MKLALAGVLALAFIVAACTNEDKCLAALSAKEFLDSGRGGTAEKDAARKIYNKNIAACSAVSN